MRSNLGLFAGLIAIFGLSLAITDISVQAQEQSSSSYYRTSKVQAGEVISTVSLVDAAGNGLPGLPSDNQKALDQTVKDFKADQKTEVLSVQVEYFCNSLTPNVGCRTTALIITHKSK